ncbi:MAG: TraR/DksA family transcriptional regulator [Limisphaerales bacterium]
MTAKKKTTKKTAAAKKAAPKKKAATKKAAAKTAAKAKEPAPEPVAKPRKPRKPKAQGPASLAAILGVNSNKKKRKGYSPSGAVKIKPDWQKFYDSLLELHEQLIQQMHGLAKDSAEEMENYSLHMGDSGTDNFDRDFALSLLSSDQDAIYEIEEALKRIEKGAYGVCELTGKNIPKARLTAIPWTRFTVEAQAQLERDGALRSRRLGSLGSVDSKGASATTSSVDVDSDDVPDSKKEKA